MAKQAPAALSMILCDAVQIDRGTGKVTILGVFESLTTARYPARHPEMTVFAELTGGRGQSRVTLEMCRTTAGGDRDVLFSAAVDIVFPNPRFVHRLVVQLAPVDFPQPGEYGFILETEGAFIAERRLIARLFEA